MCGISSTFRLSYNNRTHPKANIWNIYNIGMALIWSGAIWAKSSNNTTTTKKQPIPFFSALFTNSIPLTHIKCGEDHFGLWDISVCSHKMLINISPNSKKKKTGEKKPRILVYIWTPKSQDGKTYLTYSLFMVIFAWKTNESVIIFFLLDLESTTMAFRNAQFTGDRKQLIWNLLLFFF